MAQLSPFRRFLALALSSVAVVAVGLAGPLALAQAPTSVTVSATLHEVRAVALSDGKAGIDVVVQVRLEGWTQPSFPQVSGRLAAFTPGGERVLEPIEVEVVEPVSASEAVVRLRFERIEESPFMTAFVGLPADAEAGYDEVWTGVIFAASDIEG